MASVVIIHAAENALPARALADKIRAMRLDPVIELPPGDALSRAVDAAEAVVALWSPQSTQQEPLLAEAANAGGKLINARMQNTHAPAEFADAPTIDLTGWRGEDTFPGWRALADQIAAKTGATVPAAAGAAPRPELPPPPAFFQPGRSAPPPPAPVRAAAPPVRPVPPPVRPQPIPVREATAPRESYPPLDEEPPKRGGANLALIGVVTFLVVAGAAGGGYFFWNNMQASAETRAAWEETDKSDPKELREFLARDDIGSFGSQAQNALSNLEAERLDDARGRDTIEALQRFLRDFPESRSRAEVSGRIAELRAQPAAPTIDPITGLPVDQVPAGDVPPPPDAPRAAPLPPSDDAPIGAPPSLEAPPPPQPEPTPAPAEPGAPAIVQ